MVKPVTIDPDESLAEGLDYAYLREEGVALTQQLSGAIWTDYNEHDPGVTTLEQLCYALTDLSYRADLPLRDLLIREPGGAIDPRRQALYPARRIFPCNPVTQHDYRKLIVDRVPEVANAWMIPLKPSAQHPVRGLYDIALYVPEAVDDGCCTRPLVTLDGEECDLDGSEEIIRRARRVYSRHRDLCEDLNEARLLKFRRTEVYAEATLEDDASPESTLAQLLFNLGNFLAPELRRRSLASEIERGMAPSEIFDGPLLRHGFFEDEQLQPKASEIPVRDLVRVMARTSGVAAVAYVNVCVDEQSYSGDETIPVPCDEILRLDSRPQVEGKAVGDFTIRLFRAGVEIQPDALRVERELARMWAAYRRTFPLDEEYKRFFPFPQGTYRDLRRYYSIQNQFPRVYGIGPFGLPAGSSPPRRGQAKQFKGYLLAFEQLLADFFAQLARVKDLYSTDRGLTQTYFYQSLEKSVPDVEPVLEPDYAEGLAALVESQDPAVTRRNRFLDFLLSLYAEKLDASSVSSFTCDGRRARDEGTLLIHAKLALLHHLVAATRDRGRGFDTLGPASGRNLVGMEIKSRIQLGIKVFDHRPLSDLLDEAALDLRGDHASTFGLDRHAAHIEEHFMAIDPEGEKLAEDPGARSDVGGVVRGPLPYWRTINEELLEKAAEPENYRIGSFPGDPDVSAVCRTGEPDGWCMADKFPDLCSARLGVLELVERMRELREHCAQLYIVEHNLLRYGSFEHDSGSPPDGFSYSFTVTAVISACRGLLKDRGYRTFAREVVRENAPVHVVVEDCFLSPWQMRVFEHLYWSWRRALRDPAQSRRLMIASALLRDFLQEYQRGESSSGSVV